ncbi:hypothetical protein J6590_062823 [Homalodisca vitripennis]|nr:hypothetical protein J6590_062823 [Homalodisca vitripennis]
MVGKVPIGNWCELLTYPLFWRKKKNTPRDSAKIQHQDSTKVPRLIPLNPKIQKTMNSNKAGLIATVYKRKPVHLPRCRLAPRCLALATRLEPSRLKCSLSDNFDYVA